MPDPSLPDETSHDRSHAPAVLRSTALQVAGHVFAIALTAASTIILTRFLGVDGYGRFTVLTVFLLIGVSLSEFGLNGTAVRWFAGGERPEEIFASLIGLRLVASTVAAITALVVFALYPDNDAPAAAVALTALAMILAGVNMTIPTALQARLDFRLAVVLDLTARTVSFATYVAAAVLVTSHDPDGRLVAAALGPPAGFLVAVIVGLAAVRRLAFPIVPTFHPETWRRLMRDALPLGVVTILGLASYRLDALVLAVLKDSYDVGIYGLAYRFMEAAVPLGAFIVAAVFPLLVRGDDGHERRALQIARATDLLLIVSVGVAVATVVLAPDLVRLLGGAAYAPSVVPLRILALSLPFSFVGMLLSWTLIARGLQRRLIRRGSRSRPQPGAQSRSRADALAQGLRRRHPCDRGRRRDRPRRPRPTLGRRLPLTPFRGADRPSAGRSRSWPGSCSGSRGRSSAPSSRWSRSSGSSWPSASSPGPSSTLSSAEASLKPRLAEQSSAGLCSGSDRRRPGRTSIAPSPTRRALTIAGSPSTASRFALSTGFACPRTP